MDLTERERVLASALEVVEMRAGEAILDVAADIQEGAPLTDHLSRELRDLNTVVAWCAEQRAALAALATLTGETK